VHVLGRVNWWAPKPLARLHARFGISGSHDLPEIEPPAAQARAAWSRHGLGDQLREEILDATKVKRGLGRGVLVG
jgi:hypothetical protein